jgi:hypothetical protein
LHDCGSCHTDINTVKKGYDPDKDQEEENGISFFHSNGIGLKHIAPANIVKFAENLELIEEKTYISF